MTAAEMTPAQAETHARHFADMTDPAGFQTWPDFPADDLPTIPANFDFHPSAFCPWFRADALGLAINIEYADPAKRDDLNGTRFFAYQIDPYGDPVTGGDDLSTDEWADVLAFILRHAKAYVGRLIDTLQADNDSAPNPCPDFAEVIAGWRRDLTAAADMDAVNVVLADLAPHVDQHWHVREVAYHDGSWWTVQAETCGDVAANIRKEKDGTFTVRPTTQGRLRLPENVGKAEATGLPSFDAALQHFLTWQQGDAVTVHGPVDVVSGAAVRHLAHALLVITCEVQDKARELAKVDPFGGWTRTAAPGFTVTHSDWVDGDRPRRTWFYTGPDGIRSDLDYETEAEAWQAAGTDHEALSAGPINTAPARAVHFRVTTMTRQGLTDVADFESGDNESRARARLADSIAKPETLVAVLFARSIPAAPAWPGDWIPVEGHNLGLLTSQAERNRIAASVSARS